MIIKSLRDKGLTGFDLAEKVFELGQKGTLKYGEGISAQQQAVQEKAKLIAETARNPLEFAEQAFAQGLINIEKFGNGSFNVPQKKTAGYNYRGMKNKGRIRLTSTAQYGLTIYYMSYDDTKVTISFYSEAFFNYEKDLKVISVGFNSNPKYTDFTIEKYMGE